jgi:hypothetical protein
MKLKNFTIEALSSVLDQLKLSGKHSRMRTKFRKQLIIHLNEYIDVGNSQLIEEYVNRDENENMVFVDEEKTRVSVKEEYYKEYTSLMNEEFIIENNESNKDMLLTIAEIILNAEYELSGELADMYDIWCEEFENVIEFYEGE